MGRPNKSQPQVDIEVIKQTFSLREDGVIIRRSCHVGEFAGEPSTFVGPDNRLMVRVSVGGKVRRIVASRVAWALTVGQWPSGVVRARNGVDDDFRPGNLIVTQHGRDPFGAISDKHSRGGKASALERRVKTNTTLINALAGNSGSTVPMLSKLVGMSASCTCTRLGKLADAGLCVGPKCDSRARWDLTPAGQALAETNSQHVLDDTDRDLLEALARSPMRQLELGRRVAVCSLTAKRRLALLVERGLVSAPDARNRFAITSAGISALGDAPNRPEPWLRPELVSAASAKDVVERQGSLDDRSAAERSRHGTEARQKADRSRSGKWSYNWALSA